MSLVPRPPSIIRQRPSLSWIFPFLLSSCRKESLLYPHGVSIPPPTPPKAPISASSNLATTPLLGSWTLLPYWHQSCWWWMSRPAPGPLIWLHTYELTSDLPFYVEVLEVNSRVIFLWRHKPSPRLRIKYLWLRDVNIVLRPSLDDAAILIITVSFKNGFK